MDAGFGTTVGGALLGDGNRAEHGLPTGEDGMARIKLDERQRRLVEQAREAHRDAQAPSPPAADRLVEKWSSDVGIKPPADRHAQKNRSQKNRSQKKRAQKKGLLKMIEATERMGLYDKELEDLPARRKR